MVGPTINLNDPSMYADQGPSLREQQTVQSIAQSGASAANMGATARRTNAMAPGEVEAQRLANEVNRLRIEALEANKAGAAAKTEAIQDKLGETRKEIARVIAAAAAAKKLSREGLFATGIGSGAIKKITDATPASVVEGYVKTVAGNTAFTKLAEMRADPNNRTGGALGNITEKELDLLRSTISDLSTGKPDTNFQSDMDVSMDAYMTIFKKLGGTPDELRQEFKLRTKEDLPAPLIPGFDKLEKPKGPPLTEGTELAVGDGRNYVTEESKRAVERLQQRFDEGASLEDLNAYAAEIGVPPLPQDQVQKAIEYRQKQGPGARFLPPQTARPEIDQKIGAVADSPFGAYAIGAGNAVTGGLIDDGKEMFGDEEGARRARFARQYSQAQYPKSSFAGEFAGGVAASVPFLGAARVALPALSATKAAVAGEGALGAITGYGEAEEGNKGIGTVAGLGLGALGGAAPGVVSRIMNPKTPDGVRALRNAGMTDMSVGQSLGVPNAEAIAARYMPGGGDVALSAQRKAFDDFQTAYLNSATGHIGLTIPPGLKPTRRMELAQKAFDKAYDKARSGLKADLDPTMSAELKAFEARLAGDEFSSESSTRLAKLLEDQVRRRVKGPIGGDEFKSLSSLLGERRARFARDGNKEMADGVANLQQILDNSARRWSPAKAVKRLDDADAGYALLTRAQAAGKAPGSLPGQFTPTQLLDAVREGDLTKRGRAFNRGDALGQELAQAAVETLGEVPPRVTQAERMVGGLLTAGGSWASAPLTIGTNLAMGVANAPGIRKGLGYAIAGNRPKPVRSAGQMIADNPAYMAAPFGAAALQGARDRPTWEDLSLRYPSVSQPAPAAGAKFTVDLPNIERPKPKPKPGLADLMRAYAEDEELEGLLGNGM